MTLQARLVRYFQNHPGQRFAKSHLINVATAKMKVSPESVGRRLRVLAEVGEWQHTTGDTPEHTSARELLGDGKVTVERIGGLAHYTYTPPRTSKQRRVRVVDGRAIEEWVEVTNNQ